MSREWRIGGYSKIWACEYGLRGEGSGATLTRSRIRG
jgi:hypothetical protein